MQRNAPFWDKNSDFFSGKGAVKTPPPRRLDLAPPPFTNPGSALAWKCRILGTDVILAVLKMAVTIAARLRCVLQLYLFSVVRGPFREEFHQCVTHGKYTDIWQERLYSNYNYCNYDNR